MKELNAPWTVAPSGAMSPYQKPQADEEVEYNWEESGPSQAVEIFDSTRRPVCEIRPYGFEWQPHEISRFHLIAAAPELLEVARIEHLLHMGGFTKATAKKLGREAVDAYASAGVPGLNHWRRQKRESAIAKAEGSPTVERAQPDGSIESGEAKL